MTYARVARIQLSHAEITGYRFRARQNPPLPMVVASPCGWGLADRGGSGVQIGAFAFAAERDDDTVANQNRRGDEAEGGGIAEMLGDQCFDESGIGGEEYAELIGEAGEEATDFARGQFDEMGGNGTPCALHEELHHKC